MDQIPTIQAKHLTLALVVDGDRVLLGMKKRGFGQGYWNGFGGKLEDGEDIDKAMLRELHEECGVSAIDYHECGILCFTFEGGNEELYVHVFRITGFAGEPNETEEMRPQWFSPEAIPFREMWPDDEYWFPLFFENKKFTGAFHFSHDHKILSRRLKVVDSLTQ